MPMYVNNTGDLLLFMHIPKCAGTSIEKALRDNSKSELLFSFRSNQLPSTPQHFDKYIYQNVLSNSEPETFSVIRHPVARIISEYKWRVKKGWINAKNESLDTFINRFLNGYEKDPYAFDNHARPQVDFINQETKVFRLEYDMLDLEIYLKEVWHHNLNITRENLSSNSANIDELFISRKSLDRISKVYIEDFLSFGYRPIAIKEANISIKKITYTTYKNHSYKTALKTYLPNDYSPLSWILDKFVTPIKNTPENIIWLYWNSGEDTLPDIAKLSLQSWKKLNPDYKVVLLDDASMHEKVGFDIETIFKCSTVTIGTAGKSDLLRLLLLYLYGGVWADATTFCLQPLSHWLNTEEDFFSFLQPENCPDRQLVSWFLFSKPRAPLIKCWLEMSIQYLFKQREIRSVVGRIGVAKPFQHFPFISRTNSDIRYLDYMDSYGEVPYFWCFYLFNSVANELNYSNKLIKENSGRYVQPNENIESFLSAYVSKQTYRDDTEKFQERINYLKEQFNIVG